MKLVLELLLLNLIWPQESDGHGRLVEPPSRSSMWRFGFKTEPNYNDNELFCGGFTVQFQRHGGKCGVCGDPWHAPQPRPNEAGGKYGQGIIVRRYSQGQGIKASVQLTANHNGYFEFKLCPNNNPKRVVQQECLDSYPLTVEGTSETRYYVPDTKTRTFDVRLKLPQDVTCTQCVFQWTYTAGNNWGTCEDGSGKVGCGPQETFRGCADVAIDGDDQTNEASSQHQHHTAVGQAIRPGSVYVNQTLSTLPQKVPITTLSKPSTGRPTLKPTLIFQVTSKPIRKIPFKVTAARPTWKPSSTYYAPLKPTTVKPSFKPPSLVTTISLPTWTTPRPSITKIPAKKMSPPGRVINTVKTTTKPSFKPSFFVTTKTLGLWTTPRPSITKIPAKAMAQPSQPLNTVEDKVGDRRCKGVGAWKRLPGIDGWCDVNCARGYCPATHCLCG